MDTEIKITAPVLDKNIIQKAAQEAATRANVLKALRRRFAEHSLT